MRSDYKLNILLFRVPLRCIMIGASGLRLKFQPLTGQAQSCRTNPKCPADLRCTGKQLNATQAVTHFSAATRGGHHAVTRPTNSRHQKRVPVRGGHISKKSRSVWTRSVGALHEYGQLVWDTFRERLGDFFATLPGQWDDLRLGRQEHDGVVMSLITTHMVGPLRVTHILMFLIKIINRLDLLVRQLKIHGLKSFIHSLLTAKSNDWRMDERFA